MILHINFNCWSLGLYFIKSRSSETKCEKKKSYLIHSRRERGMFELKCSHKKRVLFEEYSLIPVVLQHCRENPSKPSLLGLKPLQTLSYPLQMLGQAND